ncbi:MAG: efflux RND transporter periplasmic adaptor subunit [Candidatus Acidiferrales bacterium]
MTRFTECLGGMPLVQRMQAKARTSVGLLALAALAAGCGASPKANADNAADPPTAVVKVTRGNIADELEIASEFQPFQDVDVYAKVSGYIHKLNVDYGSHVRKGQVLAELEIPELQQQLQQDEASVRRSQEELTRAREELNRAQSAYTVAHVTYRRLADVQKSRPELVAQQEIDVAQGKDLEASAGVSSQKAALAAAEEGLQAAKATLGKDQAMFDYSRMTAPFDGVVTQLYAYTGALLPAGTASNKSDSGLCRIAQNNPLRLVIPVPESAVPEIHLGNPVTVRVPVLGKSFRGTVARASDEVDLSTRTMHTEIDVSNPNLEIVPGMYATASIVLKQKRDALLIPVQAVDHQEGGGVTVDLIDKENKVEVRPIQLGIQTPNRVEVLSGLEQGDQVVIGNRSQLRVGMIIEPKLISAPTAVGED